MDDYYSMLGVDTDASVDDIRAAYRSRKDSLDTASDAGKADAKRLNKAWNVLSDPYQRGRYDEQRDAQSGDDDHDDDEVDDTAVAGNGKRPARAPRQRRELPAPTIQPPAGTHYPKPKQRVIAMAIDLFVLFALFIGAQYVASAVAKDREPTAYKEAQQLRDHTIPDAQKVTKDADKKADAAEKASASDAAKLRDDANKARDHERDLNDQLDKDNKKFTPIFNQVIGGFFLVGLLYLLIPTLISGRTLGKRFQRLKVVRQDGSPIRAGDAIKRYGMLILATYALFFVLGPIGAVLILVAVTTWMRNPNFQGLHDRFARTIVVTDSQD